MCRVREELDFFMLTVRIKQASVWINLTTSGGAEGAQGCYQDESAQQNTQTSTSQS